MEKAPWKTFLAFKNGVKSIQTRVLFSVEPAVDAELCLLCYKQTRVIMACVRHLNLHKAMFFEFAKFEFCANFKNLNSCVYKWKICTNVLKKVCFVCNRGDTILRQRRAPHWFKSVQSRELGQYNNF